MSTQRGLSHDRFTAMPFCTQSPMNAARIRRDRLGLAVACDGAMGLEEAKRCAKPARSPNPASPSLPEPEPISRRCSMILRRFVRNDGIRALVSAPFLPSTRTAARKTALAVAAQLVHSDRVRRKPNEQVFLDRLSLQLELRSQRDAAKSLR